MALADNKKSYTEYRGGKTDTSTIGGRIKWVRILSGYTQEEFGKLIGLSKPALANIESNRQDVRDIYKLIICSEFKIKRQWLETGEGDMASPFENLNVVIEKLLSALGYSAIRRIQPNGETVQEWRIVEDDIRAVKFCINSREEWESFKQQLVEYVHFLAWKFGRRGEGK